MIHLKQSVIHNDVGSSIISLRDPAITFVYIKSFVLVFLRIFPEKEVAEIKAIALTDEKPGVAGMN